MSSPVQIWVADHVVTMNAGRDVLSPGAVAVDGELIVAVGTPEAVTAGHPEVHPSRLAGHLLLPGLINAHHHSGLLRGTAEGLSLWDWLRLHIDPMHRVLRPEEAEAAAWLCYAEGLLSGTTTVVDMWRYMDRAARAADQLGNRLVAVPYLGAHPDFNYFDTLADNERLLADWAGAAGGRIMPWVGLEHPFYADAAGVRRAIALASEYGTGLHTHCAETAVEVPEFERRFGCRPVFALQKLGLLELPRLLLAHAVWLDPSEIALAADHGVGLSHNPVSNMKLASGVAPVTDFLAAGLDVGLGTDGEKENNNLDMFEEMKVASLLAKLRAMDAAALDSWQVLEMATIGGARAIGQGHRLGSLEVGKQADFIGVRTATPRLTPIVLEPPHANLHHNLVHAVRGGDVSLTVVAGQTVVHGGRLASAALEELIERARALVPGLFARRAAYLASVAEPAGLFAGPSEP